MIEVRSLSRYYGSFRAVADVSFSIAANEVVGFLGLNGAGKSTTLRVIAGLLPPSSGTVVVDGVDVTQAPVSFRAHIGFLPEDPPLYKEMTVSEYLRYLGRLRGMSAAQIEQRLPLVVATCQLAGREKQVISELSHGYRKRVGIAQAIIHGPRLVILDEPISGLDPYQIVEMRQVIRSLGRESTVLVSSHILPEISQTCDRILVLNKGRLVAQGTEAELAGTISDALDLELTLTGDAAAITAALQAHPAVIPASVDVKSITGDRVVVTVRLASDRREDLVTALVKAGIGIRRLSEVHGELENIFLNLTREGAA